MVDNTAGEEEDGSIVVEGAASGGSSGTLVWGVAGSIEVWGEAVVCMVAVGGKQAVASDGEGQGSSEVETDSYRQGTHLGIQDPLKDCLQGVGLQHKHFVVVGMLVMVGGAAWRGRGQ